MCLACLGSSIVHRQKNGYKLQLAKAIASFAQPLSQLFYSHSHCRCFYCELIEPLHSHQNKAIRDQLPLQCFHLKGWLCESLDIHELSLQAIRLISASLQPNTGLVLILAIWTLYLAVGCKAIPLGFLTWFSTRTFLNPGLPMEATSSVRLPESVQ